MSKQITQLEAMYDLFMMHSRLILGAQELRKAKNPHAVSNQDFIELGKAEGYMEAADIVRTAIRVARTEPPSGGEAGGKS